MSAPTDLDRTFAALSDRTRRSIVELLRERPYRAGELARALRSSPAGLSRHLRVLRQSRLVEERVLEDDARVRVYALRRAPFDALRTWLEEVEAFWTGQLASFKEHAERTRPRPGASEGGRRKRGARK